MVCLSSDWYLWARCLQDCLHSSIRSLQIPCSLTTDQRPCNLPMPDDIFTWTSSVRLYLDIMITRLLHELHCEVVRLDCDLLLMDTVNVSSRVRTIAYRMYRSPVRCSIHYLCNVNNASSSDSWCCFSLKSCSRSESEAGLKNWINLIFRIPTLRFQMRNIWNIYLRTKSCPKILKTVLQLWFGRSGQAEEGNDRSHFLWWYQSKSFPKFFKQWSSRLLVKISAAWFSVFTQWTLILFWKLSVGSRDQQLQWDFAGEMDSFELAIFPALE